MIPFSATAGATQTGRVIPTALAGYASCSCFCIWVYLICLNESMSFMMSLRALSLCFLFFFAQGLVAFISAHGRAWRSACFTIMSFVEGQQWSPWKELYILKISFFKTPYILQLFSESHIALMVNTAWIWAFNWFINVKGNGHSCKTVCVCFFFKNPKTYVWWTYLWEVADFYFEKSNKELNNNSNNNNNKKNNAGSHADKHYHEDMVPGIVLGPPGGARYEEKKKVEDPCCWPRHPIINVEGQWTVYCLLQWKKSPVMIAMHLNTKPGIITTKQSPCFETDSPYDVLNNALKINQRMWNKHQYISAQRKSSPQHTPTTHN